MATRDDERSIGVLVVTADRATGDRLVDGLEASGIDRGVTVRSARNALDCLREEDWIDCIVSDHSLPDIDGVALLQTVRAWAPKLPFVLFTGEGNESVASDAISAGVTDYLIANPDADQSEPLSRIIIDAVAYYRRHADLVDSGIQVRTVLDAAPDALLVVRNGTVAYANPRVRELLGGIDFGALADEQPRGDSGTRPPTGTPLEDILSFAGDLTATTLAAVQRGEPSLDSYETDLRLEDGTLLPVEVTAARTEWGGEPSAVVILRDVSERRTRQEDLALKTRAMDSAPIGIAIAESTTDGENNPLVYVNDAFTAITGYDREEALGHDCRFLQGTGTDEETVAAIGRAVGENETLTTEILNYRKDGTPFWNRLTVAPIDPDRRDEPHYVGFQEDITYEHDRRQELRRFRRAVESAGQAIFVTDLDGTITQVNPAFEEITGYSREEAIGSTPKLLQSGQHDDDYYNELWETILSGGIWDHEVVDERRSGELYYAHQTIAPLLNEDGEAREFVAIQSDITARKEREQQLQMLDRVLRHNLRTELNVVEGHSDAILNVGGEDVHHHATVITESVDALLETAERGRRITQLLSEPPQRRSGDIVMIVQRVIAGAHTAYPDATIEADLPDEAMALMVEQIDEAITELVENAIIHNDAEEPTVTVRVRAPCDEESIQIEIIDDGPGIAAMERDVLEEVQEEGKLIHGSGLGLWHVYWLVRRSNGRLEFEDRDPRGTVVTISLNRAEVLREGK